MLLLGVVFAGLLYDDVLLDGAAAGLVTFWCLMLGVAFVIPLFDGMLRAMDVRTAELLLMEVLEVPVLLGETAEAAALPDDTELAVLETLEVLLMPLLIGVLLVNTLSDPVLWRSMCFRLPSMWMPPWIGGYG